jgi:hypothetical protein
MSWRDRVKDSAEQLQKRAQESSEKGGSSGKFPDFLRDDLDVPKWMVGEGDHLIDVLPYIVGDNHPDPKIKPGSVGYVLMLFVHENVGTQEASYVCPARNYGKRCPICEQQRALKKSGLEWDDPQVKALEPKKKTMYNIVCYDSEKDEKKGVQIWVTAWWNFERHVAELSKATPRGGGFVAFAHEDNGKSVAFKRSGKKMTDTKYEGHRFVDRDYTIPDELLDQTFCLEEIVYIPSYEEIYEAHFARPYNPEEAAAARPAPADTSPPPAAAIAGAGGRLRGNVNREGDVPQNVEARTSTGTAGGSASTQTATRLSRTAAPPPPSPPPPPPPQRPAQAAPPVQPAQPDPPPPLQQAGTCPSGGTFGSDIDRLDPCTECQIWDDCRVEADRLAELSRRNRDTSRLNRNTRRA